MTNENARGTLSENARARLVEIWDYAPLLTYPAEREIDFRLRVDRAVRLCEAVERAHAEGQVLADLANVHLQIWEDGAVSVLQTEPIYRVSKGRRYRHVLCEAGYMAPEVLRQCLPAGQWRVRYALPAEGGFTARTDDFTLAVLLFRLLMHGCHPYGEAKGEELDARVERGETPFFRHLPGIPLPPQAPDLAALPPHLRALFAQAFTGAEAARPGAAAWRRALTEFRAELRDSPCGRKAHAAWSDAPLCPYCAADARWRQAQRASGPHFEEAPWQEEAQAMPWRDDPTAQPQTAQPQTARPRSAGRFWAVTVLLGLAIQVYMAAEVMPGLFREEFTSEKLIHIGAVGGLLAGMASLLLYNAIRACGGRCAWWDYLLSPAVSLLGMWIFAEVLVLTVWLAQSVFLAVVVVAVLIVLVRVLCG